MGKIIAEQIKYNTRLNEQVGANIYEVNTETLYDEITDFLSKNHKNASVNFDKTKSPLSVMRSANFQFFKEHDGNVTVANKFFN